MLHMASTGCQWRRLPKDFPPVSTAQRYLAVQARKREGHEVSPSAGVLDNQAVKAAEADGVGGYDAGRKIRGRNGAPAVPKSTRRACPWRHRPFADSTSAGPTAGDPLPRLRGEAGRGDSSSPGLRARGQVTSSSRRSITESTSRIFWPRFSSRGPSLTEYSAAARPLRPVLATL